MKSESIVIRERGPWEAIDAGILLLRRSWRVLAAWALALLPCILLAAVPGYRNPWLGILVLWLLKPLLDRILVTGFGAALIGEELSPFSLVRRSFSCAPAALIWETTWFRAVPWRLYLLPIRCLERQRGAAFRKRRKTISAEWVWPATALRVFSVCVEWGAFFGSGLLLQWLFSAAFFSRALGANESLAALGLLVLYGGAMTVSEALHAASAFGLYINRRIWLEGWDIERSFTVMAERVSAAHSGATTSGRWSQRRRASLRPPVVFVVLWALTALTFSTAQSARAEELPRELTKRIPQERQVEIERELQHILDQPQFDRYDQAVRWRWKNGSGFEWNAELPQPEFLKELFRAMARILPWTVAAVLLAVALLTFTRYAGRWARPAGASPSSAPEPPQRRDRSPVQPSRFSRRAAPGFSSRALQAWQQGRSIDAMEELYFGAAAFLERCCGAAPPGSATEEERSRFFARRCGKSADEQLPKDEELVALFSRTTAAWSAWAYGMRSPSDSEFSQLCARWQAKERQS